MNKMNIKSFGLVLATCFGLIGCAPTSEPTSTPSVEEPTTVPTTEPTTTPTSEPTSEPTTAPSISVPGGVIVDDIPSGTFYEVGDQVYDFSIKDINNNVWDLLTAVNTKKLVVINFFASWCGPCHDEMPAIEEAYREYQDDVEVIAISTEPTDTGITLKNSFVNRYQLTFPVAIDKTSEVLTPFLNERVVAGLENFYIPYTVFIDRYGTFVKKIEGSVPNAASWKGEFKKYTKDDYVQSF